MNKKVKSKKYLYYEWAIMEAEDVHQLPGVGVAGQVQLQLPLST